LICLDRSCVWCVSLPQTLSPTCRLDISFSRLDALPPSLYAARTATSRLAGLVYVDASHNGLTRLPETDPAIASRGPAFLFHLASVLFLDLSHNAITELPDEVARCGTLRELRLSRNALTTLPPSFFEMPSLEVLDVSHNRLGALPDSLLRASSLTSLNAGSNALASLPQEYAPTEEEAAAAAAFNTGNALVDEALNAARRAGARECPLRGCGGTLSLVSRRLSCALGFIEAVI
jgi:hypothetical protein